MQSVAHFLVGSAVSRYVPAKPVGLGLAFASHFVVDMLPSFNDWSLLPGEMQLFVGPYWYMLLGMEQIGVVVVAALVWKQFYGKTANEPAWVSPAYIVGGGLMGALPDYLGLLSGGSGPLARLNSASHVWVQPYLRFVGAHGDLRPLVAGALIALELIVVLMCGYLVFRERRTTEWR